MSKSEIIYEVLSRHKSRLLIQLTAIVLWTLVVIMEHTPLSIIILTVYTLSSVIEYAVEIKRFKDAYYEKDK